MLPLLLFHKAFHLLQFLFSCASANRCLKAVIGAPSTSFNFSMSFYKLRLHCLCCVFRVSVSEVFVFIKLSLLLRVRSSFAGDEATGGFWDTPKFGDTLLGLAKLLGSGFLGFVISGLSNLKPIPFCWLFACRMVRGQEETSTSQAGCRRGTTWEMPTASSLVAAMSVEELRSFCKVPADIRLELSDGAAVSTVGGAGNSVYFTREQFVADLRFPISSLVKQFLHFTRAPPALIHPNVFRILMGCSVLKFLYQLDISLVEICFIYTLKLRIGCRLSMLTHSPRLQFVTRLPNSLETEAKGVVLVRGPWYETLGSLRLPFDLNQSLMFSGLSQLDGVCSFLDRPHSDMPLFFRLCR